MKKIISQITIYKFLLDLQNKIYIYNPNDLTIHIIMLISIFSICYLSLNTVIKYHYINYFVHISIPVLYYFKNFLSTNFLTSLILFTNYVLTYTVCWNTLCIHSYVKSNFNIFIFFGIIQNLLNLILQYIIIDLDEIKSLIVISILNIISCFQIKLLNSEKDHERKKNFIDIFSLRVWYMIFYTFLTNLFYDKFKMKLPSNFIYLAINSFYLIFAKKQCIKIIFYSVPVIFAIYSNLELNIRNSIINTIYIPLKCFMYIAYESKQRIYMINIDVISYFFSLYINKYIEYNIWYNLVLIPWIFLMRVLLLCNKIDKRKEQLNIEENNLKNNIDIVINE